MPKTKISEFSATPANNTDIDSINIAEGCAPSGINDAIRELMAQLKDFQTGAVGDSFNGPVGTSTAAAGAFTTLSASGTTTLSGLTASTALALDASKNVVSVTNTGTGNNVLATSPTLVTPALGTPSALVGTNITGTATSFNINGTVGATTPTTGAFTTVAASGNVTLSGGTANGVAYLNGSKVVTSGSALTFDGTTLSATQSSAAQISLNNASGNYLFLTAAGGAAYIDNRIPSDLNFRGGGNFIWGVYGGSEQMRLNSTGLGIGTSSPSGKLTVANTYTNTSDATIVASSSIPGISLRSTSTGRFSIFSSYNANNSTSFLVGTGTNNPSTVAMYIDHSTGYLGIGTTGPVTQLQVNSGSSYVVGFKSTVANGFIALQDSGTSGALTDGNVAIGAISNDLAFRSGGATRMRLDSAGNLGLGVTPSVFNSGVQAIQVGAGVLQSTTGNNTVFGSNTYFATTGGNRYAVSDYATAYGQNAGGHYWSIAASGTAGNVISFTQAMTLDTSGQLGIGTTSPVSILEVKAANPTLTLSASGTSGSTNKLTFKTGFSGVNGDQNIAGINAELRISGSTVGGSSAFVTVYTGNTERIRIQEDGNVGIGTSSASTKLHVKDTRATLRLEPTAVGGTTFDIRNGVSGGAEGGLSFYDITNSATRAVIDSSGNFLVGTTSNLGNASRLSVQVDGSFSGVAFARNTDNTFAVATDYYKSRGSAASPTAVQNGDDVYQLRSVPYQGSAYTYLNSMVIQIDGTYTSGQNPPTRIAWYTNTANGSATERARIDASGNLLVGATSTSGYFDSKANFYSPSVYASFSGKQGGASSAGVGTSWHTATSGDNLFHTFVTEASPTIRGSITYNRAGGLVAYNVTSDYRAKDISGPVTGSGALIDSIPVYMGTMKGATQERPMFIAHETPSYAHTGAKDAVDADGNPVYQQMDASALIPVMWAEIQSLRQRVAQLESN